MGGMGLRRLVGAGVVPVVTCLPGTEPRTKGASSCSLNAHHYLACNPLLTSFLLSDCRSADLAPKEKKPKRNGEKDKEFTAWSELENVLFA